MVKVEGMEKRIKEGKEAETNEKPPLWVNHFVGGGLCTNSTPFMMLPFKSVLQASRSFFSSSFTSGRMLVAFSAPEG